MSILGGYGLACMLRGSFILIKSFAFGKYCKLRSDINVYCRQSDAVLSCLIVSLWVGFTLPRLIDEIIQLRSNSLAGNDICVSQMRKYSSKTKWCYTLHPEYAFHSGLIIPPELLVLPAKRFLATDLSKERILAIVKAYKPEVLLLDRSEELSQTNWIQWIKKDYILTTQNDFCELWISRELNPDSINKVQHSLDSMGL